MPSGEMRQLGVDMADTAGKDFVVVLSPVSDISFHVMSLKIEMMVFILIDRPSIFI